jgi:predicted dehydrogenase
MEATYHWPSWLSGIYHPRYYSDSRWKGTQRLDGGGALINQGIHGLDLLLFLVGEDVVSVSARTAVRAHKDIEVEDTAAAVLTFHSGALGVLQASE